MKLRGMSAQQYDYSSAEEAWADDHIAARVIRALTANGNIERDLDAGCGNGNLSARIAAQGFAVSAFDASTSGVEHAQRAFPALHFPLPSAYHDLHDHSH